jgi:hypothetical protein
MHLPHKLYINILPGRRNQITEFSGEVVQLGIFILKIRIQSGDGELVIDLDWL